MESLIEHPGAMTHASAAGSPLEVPANLVRLSVGVESSHDLVEDLRNAGSSDGRPSVLVILNRQPGANIIETVDRIRAEIPRLQRWIRGKQHLLVLNRRDPYLLTHPMSHERFERVKRHVEAKDGGAGNRPSAAADAYAATSIVFGTIRIRSRAMPRLDGWFSQCYVLKKSSTGGA